jgi:hypothetical protein
MAVVYGGGGVAMSTLQIAAAAFDRLGGLVHDWDWASASGEMVSVTLNEQSLNAFFGASIISSESGRGFTFNVGLNEITAFAASTAAKDGMSAMRRLTYWIEGLFGIPKDAQLSEDACAKLKAWADDVNDAAIPVAAYAGIAGGVAGGPVGAIGGASLGAGMKVSGRILQESHAIHCASPRED